MTSWITVCDTCRRTGTDAASGAATDGERFALLVEAAADRTGGKVGVRRHSCLMGCTRACNVVVQGRGKICYTLGEFAPDAKIAEALVEYALGHADSETGRVPFRDWPQAIKGHFVSRHPPLPDE